MNWNLKKKNWNCFNPCFNGSDSKRGCRIPPACPEVEVSILVLMEVTLKATASPERIRFREVSILVLMEVTLKASGISEVRR